jgi:hypothetical protein
MNHANLLTFYSFRESKEQHIREFHIYAARIIHFTHIQQIQSQSI